MVLKIAGFYNRSMPNLVWDDDFKGYVIALDQDIAEDEIRMGTWMFLFIDLIFVAVVSKCADIVLQCAISIHTIIFTSTIITVMFVTRLHLDDYCNRFYVNDVFHRILYFSYAVCMFIMCLNINVEDTNGNYSDAACKANIYTLAFGTSFFFTRFIIIVLQLSVILADDTYQALRQFAGQVLSYAISAFIVLTLILTEYDDPKSVDAGQRINIYITCMVIEITYSIYHHVTLSFGTVVNNISLLKCCHGYLVAYEVYPLDIVVFQERIGSFIMLILGEVLITTLKRYYDVKYPEQTYPFNILTMMVVFMFGLLYYDATRAEVEDHHAMIHSLLSGFLYLWLHLIVSITMFFTNAAIGVIYEESTKRSQIIVTSEQLPDDDDVRDDSARHKAVMTGAQLLSTSMGLTIVLLSLVGLLHNGIEQLWSSKIARRNFLIKIFLGILHFIVPAAGVKEGTVIVTIHTILLGLAVVSEVRILENEDAEDSDSNNEHQENNESDDKGNENDKGGVIKNNDNDSKMDESNDNDDDDDVINDDRVSINNLENGLSDQFTKNDITSINNITSLNSDSTDSNFMVNPIHNGIPNGSPQTYEMSNRNNKFMMPSIRHSPSASPPASRMLNNKSIGDKQYPGPNGFIINNNNSNYYNNNGQQQHHQQSERTLGVINNRSGRISAVSVSATHSQATLNNYGSKDYR